jgi:hypothetical protein
VYNAIAAGRQGASIGAPVVVHIIAVVTLLSSVWAVGISDEIVKNAISANVPSAVHLAAVAACLAAVVTLFTRIDSAVAAKANPATDGQAIDVKVPILPVLVVIIGEVDANFLLARRRLKGDIVLRPAGGPHLRIVDLVSTHGDAHIGSCAPR